MRVPLLDLKAQYRLIKDEIGEDRRLKGSKVRAGDRSRCADYDLHFIDKSGKLSNRISVISGVLLLFN